jgi:hypothetical protein
MQETLPPAPESRKRILPAFLLCFFLGGTHRIYAGKIISGIVQFGLFVGTTIWSYESVKGLFAILHSGTQDPMVLFQNMSDWNEAHGSSTLLPSAAATVVLIWITVDAVRLLRKKFKDGQGLLITRWL